EPKPRLGRQLAGEGTKIEIAVVGGERAHRAGIDDVDLDRSLEEPSGGQHLEFEIQAFAAPDRALAAEANLSVLVIIEILGALDCIRGGRLEILFGKLSGKLLNGLVVKCRAGLSLRVSRRRAAEGEKTDGERPAQGDMHLGDMHRGDTHRAHGVATVRAGNKLCRSSAP